MIIPKMSVGGKRELSESMGVFPGKEFQGTSLVPDPKMFP